MAIINMKRNIVYAYDVEPDDVFVRVGWLCSLGDGKHSRYRLLGYFPITMYQEWVDWALSVADQMEHPIHVMTINHDDFFGTARFGRYREFLANMTEHESGQLRQIIVDACASILRDCSDIEVRAEAHRQLETLGVVRQ